MITSDVEGKRGWNYGGLRVETKRERETKKRRQPDKWLVGK